MFDVLDDVLSRLPNLLYNINNWQSVVINRRKPHTFRLERQEDGFRICLHRFEPCEKEDAFPHPHRYPAACQVLQGKYSMLWSKTTFGFSVPYYWHHMELSAGSRYKMTHPYEWHAVQPLERCYSIAIFGEEWDEKQRHDKCVTVKGKGLQSMEPDAVSAMLLKFKTLLGD